FSGGWAAVGSRFAVYAKTKQEAERRFALATQSAPMHSAAAWQVEAKTLEADTEVLDPDRTCQCHHSEAAHRSSRGGMCSFCYCPQFSLAIEERVVEDVAPAAPPVSVEPVD
ncbi:MAG TPA: hypothetical protein VKU60_19520, partial [Chloroflexota bacterium]|nr:hypothetical protein [Chloroflexota bacterium]